LTIIINIQSSKNRNTRRNFPPFLTFLLVINKLFTLYDNLYSIEKFKKFKNQIPNKSKKKKRNKYLKLWKNSQQ
jgi:hypothetical protein